MVVLEFDAEIACTWNKIGTNKEYSIVIWNIDATAPNKNSIALMDILEAKPKVWGV